MRITYMGDQYNKSDQYMVLNDLEKMYLDLIETL